MSPCYRCRWIFSLRSLYWAFHQYQQRFESPLSSHQRAISPRGWQTEDQWKHSILKVLSLSALYSSQPVGMVLRYRREEIDKRRFVLCRDERHNARNPNGREHNRSCPLTWTSGSRNDWMTHRGYWLAIATIHHVVPRIQLVVDNRAATPKTVIELKLWFSKMWCPWKLAIYWVI